MNFVPGAVKYGDLHALLALNAPRPLWVAGEAGGMGDVVRGAYHSCQASEQLHNVVGDRIQLIEAAIGAADGQISAPER